MWSLLRLLSVILGHTWVLYTISTLFVSTLSSSAAAETTSPFFQEILLINQRDGENTFKQKTSVITIPVEEDPPTVPSYQAKATDIGTANEDAIDSYDLIQFVTQLEKQAQSEEKTESFPEVLGILEKDFGRRYNGNDSLRTTSQISLNNSQLTEEWNLEGKHLEHEDEYFLANNDSSCLPVDLSDITEDIVDRIAEGVEESLRISDDGTMREEDQSRNNGSVETRQLSVYLFQGQYVPEPRLNRFIDGAIRNMGTELRIAVMDPLYFRVLPRGRVELRDKPVQTINVNIKRPLRNKNGNVNRNRRRRQQKPQPGRFNFNRNILNRRRRQRQRQKQKQQQRRKRQKQQQLLMQRKKKKQQQIKTQQQKLRIRRRTLQNVGGGSVSGLSRVTRDGDAEMQLFGNYTLIRSHMKLGPVELMMQFRTQRGVRRTAATLPVLRVHSVTRVNQEGSEMIDFLLDRPHPETIKVRGKLFPLAERIARNIFARLFLPESFLVQRVREKAGLALLSKPNEK